MENSAVVVVDDILLTESEIVEDLVPFCEIRIPDFVFIFNYTIGVVRDVDDEFQAFRTLDLEWDFPAQLRTMENSLHARFRLCSN